MSDVILRQWAMLRLVPRLPRKIDASRIKTALDNQGYKTTLRTIQRDLNALSRLFPIVCDESNKPYGWSWLADAPVMEMPGMDPQTALTFHLSKKFLEPLLPKSTLKYLDPYFKRAGDVLQQLQTPGLGNWAKKVRIVPRNQPLLPAKTNAQVVNTLYLALLEDRKVNVNYKPRGENEVKEYQINPLGLVLRDGVDYLLATLWDYDDIKQLALHRFKKAEVSEERCKKPKGFCIDDYIESGAFGYTISDKVITLKALFDAEVAQHLEETPLCNEQQMKPQTDGRVLLEAKVQDTAQLRWWLTGFGDKVTVTAPKSLRQVIQSNVKQMVKNYGI